MTIHKVPGFRIKDNNMAKINAEFNEIKYLRAREARTITY
jgi:hypothetical protein